MMVGRTLKPLKERIPATFRRRKLPLILIVGVMILTLGYYPTEDSSVHNHQKIYEFASSSFHPSFLDPVDVDTELLPIGYTSIDRTHRLAKVHTGNWIHVTSADQKVLLLKRGPQLVTCPNSWGLVGEHSNGDESGLETTQRALVEEIWGGRNRSALEVDYYQNLTEHPLYFLREYPNGRVDRQVTHLYEARFRQTSDQIRLKLDDEVWDHQWISLEEYRKWLYRENADEDFCHSTIVQLCQLGLERLLQFHNQQH